MSKIFGLHRVPLSVGPPRRHKLSKETEAIEHSEYADSVSSTAREFPEVEYIVDNFESGTMGSDEIESIQWGSKVIYNEDIAQESEPTPVRLKQETKIA